MSLYLINCTRTICDQVASGRPQRDIAQTYAMAMQSAAAKMDTPDWQIINRAILSRWKMSGLERIKKLAYDFATGKKSPEPLK